MKYLFFFIIYFQSFFCFGNDTTKCKCQYYSSYNALKYQSELVNIGKKLHTKYGKVIAIGSRSFSEANALFIIIEAGEVKGFYYDFQSRKNKTITGDILKEMNAKIPKDTLDLLDAERIKKSPIDHDFSFFVYLDYGRPGKLYEICYSQILNLKAKPVQKAFTYYIDKLVHGD